MRAFGSLIRPFIYSTKSLIAVFFVLAVIAALPASADPSTAEMPATTEPAPPIVLRSRVFDIPFQVEGDSKASAVTLFVSADRGKTWQPAAKKPIPLSSFHYEADSDGEFWFAHATDSDQKRPDQKPLSAELKILIDSAGPAIKLTGEANLEGKLSGNLKLHDAHQVAALRILYATDVTREWKVVENASVDRAGGFVIDPEENWQRISIHITAEDSLGHGSVEQKEFRRPRIASTRSNQYVDTPTKPRLEVRPAAGPSDPPKLLLGPSFSGATNQSLQSPGSGPANVPINNRLRTHSRTPGGATSRPLNRTNPANSYGAGFGVTGGAGFEVTGAPNQPQQPRRTPPTFTPSSPPATTTTAPPATRPSPLMTSTVSRQPDPKPQPGAPRTLPASGVTATVTPEGIEVLPAPTPNSQQPPATTEDLPKPQSVTPDLNAPLPSDATPSPSGLPASPGDPITKPVPVAPPNTSQQPRSVRDMMRPLNDGASANVPGNQIRTNPLVNGSENAQRYRADRAEQITRQKQQLFDAAQLSRNVPFRFSDTNRFSLEYELEAVGATGVEAVELYGSLDGGKSWKRWGADPDRQSPFDIETKGEGVFSFRIVVLGNNGLASPSPLPGDTPDIAVIVDQTRPSIRITSAQYGEGDRTGSLVVRYECDDEHLTTRPVSLSFGASLDGPWTTISAGLRNDGLYVWPADPKLPPAIFIRVDATDKAGNKGTYVLDQPIATGGLAPRARILGFRSR